MKMNLIYYLFLAAASLSAAELRQDKNEPDVFTVKEAKHLSISYRGAELIAGDAIEEFADMAEAEKIIVSKQGDISAVNVFSEKRSDLKFRRETAIKKDGSCELTVKVDYAPDPNGARGYKFWIPISVFQNAQYFVRQPDIAPFKGMTITDKSRNGPIYTDIDFISLTINGRKINIDFNPYGIIHVHSMTTRGFGGETEGAFNMLKEDDKIVFQTFYQAKGSNLLYSTLYSAKINISEGECNYGDIHKYLSWNYHGNPCPAEFRFAFGTNEEKGGIIPAGITRYNNDNGFGWTGAVDSLQLQKSGQTNTFPNSLYSKKGNNTFVFDLLPGVYVYTLSLGSEKAVGPMDIYVNDQLAAKDITVPAGGLKQILATRYTPDGEQARVRLEGRESWALRALSAQMMLTKYEYDFYSKDLWNISGLFEPDFYLNEKINVSSPIMAEPQKNANQWCYDMQIGHWTHGFYGTGFEYNTRALVEKRVTDLKKQGYDTIMYSTYFNHLSFVHRWDDYITMMKLIVDVAHKNEMKVVYHIDVPVVTLSGTGLKYIWDHPDWYQQEIQTALPTFAILCLNNPGFREEFFGRLTKLTRITQVDGFMLDECYWGNKNCCGCPYCREKFVQDTKSALPYDPNSRVFHNYDDPLWIKWMGWRFRSIEDWWRACMTAIKKGNPNAQLICYLASQGIKSGMLSQYGTHISEYQRGCSVIGNENQSRNKFFINYRAEYSLAKIYSAVGDDLKTPVLNFVKNGYNKTVGVFAWGLSQMNRQAALLWLKDATLSRYLHWTEKMDARRAKTCSDIAVLYSVSYRDDKLESDSFFDKLGYSEMLTDEHVLHDFIIESSLTPDVLKKYKALILASVANLSRKQAEIIRQFVRNGGCLFVSGYAGIEDDLYARQGNFLIADVLGVDYQADHPEKTGNFKIKYLSGKIIPFTGTFFKTTVHSGSNIELIANIDDDKGASYPAIVVNKYGQGQSIFMACQIGTVNCENEIWKNENIIWDFEKNKGCTDIFKGVLKHLGVDMFNFKNVSIPEKVLVNMHSVMENDGRLSMVVHLLNATGVEFPKKGTTLKPYPFGGPDESIDNFPSLKEDIVFDIKTDNSISRGYIVSPDFDGKREIRLEKIDNGYYRVVINKKDLKVYSLVYLIPPEKEK